MTVLIAVAGGDIQKKTAKAFAAMNSMDRGIVESAVSQIRSERCT